MRWDPEQYVRYADERGRPFVDLIARIDATAPRRVVDLGCGPGTLTALLCSRWPAAQVEGIDASPEMIASAAAVPGPVFRVGDARAWSPVASSVASADAPADAAPGTQPPDVIVSNATLQWVPGHAELLRAWAAALAPDGWLAFQVPGNFDSPSHVLMRELAESPRWAPVLGGVLRHADAVATPAQYAALLAEAGLVPDVWETTYLHLLPGADPVLEWVRGTGLRPVLAALSDGERDEFVASYSAALHEAYPAGPHGTTFPFRRIFAVGHKPA